MMLPIPTPSEQLNFFTKLQRIFSEGEFTATYKFALLISLADLAVELGSDNGNELILTNRQIGYKFISLYWNQSLPYGTGRIGCEPGILLQNNGTQAAVISAIMRFREQTKCKTFNSATSESNFNQLLTSVTNTVSTQPLTYLQNFGGTKDEFIFDRTPRSGIVLKPGVSYCLRRFYPLIQHLSRNHWITHIKDNRQNISILGEADDLEDFLFETSRQSLVTIGAELRQLDGPTCFYCGRNMSNADVDHFIPFSLYPRDLAQNFVLSHPSCNRSKSDSLAALTHLERWLIRMDKKSDAISEIASKAGFVTNSSVIHKVGAWAYANARQANGKAWVSANNYSAIDDAYLSCFEINS